GRQELGDAVANDGQVLDADAAEAGEVNAGLDRDHVAGLEDVLGLAREPRPLVHGEADAVAEAVAEALAEPRPFENVAREPVRIDARHARPDSLDRRELRLQ